MATAMDDHPLGPPKSGKQRRVYKCSTCQRIFKRSEHCSRHERIHTRERPFSCQFCHKRYARKDLVTRHEKTLHADKFKDGASSRRSSESSATINVSLSSTSSAEPKQRKRVNPDYGSPKEASPVEDTIHVSPWTDFHPQDLGFVEHRRDSHIAMASGMIPSPFQAEGTIAEGLYQDPQTSSAQLHGSILQPVTPQMTSFQGTSMDDAYFPIDPQLCDPQQPLDIEPFKQQNQQISPSSRGLEFPAADARHDSMFPNKRRRLSDEEEQMMQVPMNEAYMDDEPTSIDIFRDFWSPPEAPTDFSRGALSSMMTPDSLDFSIPIDPCLAGAQQLSLEQQQQNENLSSEFTLADSLSSFENDRSGEVTERFAAILQEKASHVPEVKFNEDVHQRLCEDLQARIKKDDWDRSIVPGIQELPILFESYISCFHRHLPIIHFQSLDLETTPSPLVLAICCIGALYRLDQRRAAALYELAVPLLYGAISVSRRSTPPAPGPLWAVQGCLLLAVYAVFSGRPALVLATLERMAFFTTEYRLRRTSHATEPEDDAVKKWQSWVDKESSKRLLCGIFVLSNLVSIAYGSNLWFSVVDDLFIDLPEEESLWEAQTAERWKELRALKSPPPLKTIRDAMESMMFNPRRNQATNETERVSGFTTLIIAYAANVHVRHLIQFTQCTSGISASESLRLPLVTEALSALERCRQAFTDGLPDDQTKDTMPSDDAESTLVFNSHALLRTAYIRLLSTTTLSNRLILLSDDSAEITAVLTDFVATPQPRTPLLTMAANKAYEGWLTPLKIGQLFVRKTAAFSWSVEHAVVGWDGALFLTKWVHDAEMQERAGGRCADAEEKTVMEQLKGVLREMESEWDGEGSLAAAVARASALFLTDTWVWGVTPRMGNVLVRLAGVCEKRYQEGVGHA